MKTFIISILCLALSPHLAFAKNGEPETEAIYIVPSPPELVSHSRFIMQIIEPYINSKTEKISYIFPEILIGEKNRLIEFSRIEGTQNSWTSDLLTLHCTIIDDTYSCNVLVNKPPQQGWINQFQTWVLPKAHAATGSLCQGLAITHLSGMGLSQNDVAKFTSVVGNFCSNEPAGFFSYEFQ